MNAMIVPKNQKGRGYEQRVDKIRHFVQSERILSEYPYLLLSLICFNIANEIRVRQLNSCGFSLQKID